MDFIIFILIVNTYLPKIVLSPIFKFEIDDSRFCKKDFYFKLIVASLLKMGLFFLGVILAFLSNLNLNTFKENLIPYSLAVFVSSFFYGRLVYYYEKNKKLMIDGEDHWNVGVWVDLSILFYCVLQGFISKKPIWWIGTSIWIAYFFVTLIQNEFIGPLEREYFRLSKKIWCPSYTGICIGIFSTSFLYYMPISLYAPSITATLNLIGASSIAFLVLILNKYFSKDCPIHLTRGLFGLGAFMFLIFFASFSSLLGLTFTESYTINTVFLTTPSTLQKNISVSLFSIVICWVFILFFSIFSITLKKLRGK